MKNIEDEEELDLAVLNEILVGNSSNHSKSSKPSKQKKKKKKNPQNPRKISFVEENLDESVSRKQAFVEEEITDNDNSHSRCVSLSPPPTNPPSRPPSIHTTPPPSQIVPSSSTSILTPYDPTTSPKNKKNIKSSPLNASSSTSSLPPPPPSASNSSYSMSSSSSGTTLPRTSLFSPSSSSPVTVFSIPTEVKHFNMTNLVHFAYRTLERTHLLQCKLVRSKSSHLDYTLFTEEDNRFIMGAKNLGMDGFLLTAAPYEVAKGGDFYLGKIKKPFGKKYYILYSNGLNPRKVSKKWNEKSAGNVFKTFDRVFREEMMLLEFDRDKNNLNQLDLYIPVVDPITRARRVINPVHQNTGIEYLKSIDLITLASHPQHAALRSHATAPYHSPSLSVGMPLSSSSSSSHLTSVPSLPSFPAPITFASPFGDHTPTTPSSLSPSRGGSSPGSLSPPARQQHSTLSTSVSTPVFAASSESSSSSSSNPAVGDLVPSVLNLQHYTNRKAVYNLKTNMYLLNFHKRAKIASIKNIQLVPGSNRSVSEAEVPAVLLMGKMDDSTFSLDFTYPLCPLQAFAIAIGVFDNN